MATTNNKGEFSIPLTLTSTEDTQSVLKISAPGYESVTIIPFKGNGDVKSDLGIIFLTPKIKNLEKNKEELTKLNKELDECVKKQDFEKAIEYRDKIKALK